MKIELRNINYEPNRKVVIEDISLIINEGITTFLGQNGSGKTTLMKLMCNIIEPTNA